MQWNLFCTIWLLLFQIVLSGSDRQTDGHHYITLPWRLTNNSAYENGSLSVQQIQHNSVTFISILNSISKTHHTVLRWEKGMVGCLREDFNLLVYRAEISPIQSPHFLSHLSGIKLIDSELHIGHRYQILPNSLNSSLLTGFVYCKGQIYSAFRISILAPILCILPQKHASCHKVLLNACAFKGRLHKLQVKI